MRPSTVKIYNTQYLVYIAIVMVLWVDGNSAVFAANPVPNPTRDSPQQPGGPTVQNGTYNKVVDKTACGAPDKETVSVFTCEGYPAFNPNNMPTSDIGSTDGVHTNCGTIGFISAKGTGYQSYEFAARYMWFRWGINMTQIAVTGPVPGSAQPPTESSLAGLGANATTANLCNLSENTLAGTTAYKPADITPSQQPVPGDLVVLNAGHVGVIVGTKNDVSGQKVTSIAYANQNVSTIDVAKNTGGYTVSSPTDPGICMYIHANANKSTSANSCTPPIIGASAVQPTPPPPPAGTAASLNGSFTGYIAAIDGLVSGVVDNAIATIGAENGIINGTITGTEDGAGNIKGILSGTITYGITEGNDIGDLTGTISGTFTGTDTNGLINGTITNAIDGSSITGSGSAIGSIQSGTISGVITAGTSKNNAIINATLSGTDRAQGVVVGGISGSITSSLQ